MVKKYYAVRDGFILGGHYKAGEPVPLTEGQAKYLTSPLGDDLTLKPPARTTKSAKKRNENGGTPA